jgi:hypothetical protein
VRDTVKASSLERVDLQDFDALADSLSRANHAQIPDQAFTDPARGRLWVLGGFAMTNPAAKQLQVARGRAILATRIAGVVEYGQLTSEGDLTKVVDLNAYAPGTYYVYIRFERVEGDLESRAFWDPSGGGSEYSQAVNTRYTANWSVRVEASSPGAEWLLIGEVDQATMAIVDRRPFFFEGTADSTFASGWSTDGGGIANDRSAARATYGAGDLQMYCAAVRQCLEDIKGRGLRRWWDRDIGGMNIGFDAAPVEDELAVGDANFRLSLALAAQPRAYFDATDYLDFTRPDNWFHFVIGGVVELEIEAAAFGPGTAGKSLGMADSGERWGTAYLDKLDLNQVDGQGVVADLKPTTDDVSDLGTAARRWEFLRVAKDVIADRDVLTDGLEITALPAAGGGVRSDLQPDTTGTYSLGDTNYRWLKLCLAQQLDIYSGATAYSKIYGGAAAANNRFWQWVIGASGELVLQGGTDAGAGLFDLLGINRAGVAAGSALLYARGAIMSKMDSGYPATWNPSMRVTGVNPMLRLEDNDPTIDPECSMWGIWVRKGAADESVLSIGALLSTGESVVGVGRAIEITTLGGAANQYFTNLLALRSYGNIELYAPNGFVQVDGTVELTSDAAGATGAGHVGLGNGYTLGAAGGGTGTIKFAVAGGANDSTGFLKIYVNGTARYVPFFDVN